MGSDERPTGAIEGGPARAPPTGHQPRRWRLSSPGVRLGQNIRMLYEDSACCSGEPLSVTRNVKAPLSVPSAPSVIPAGKLPDASAP